MRRAKSKSGFYREKWVCRPRRQIIDRDGFGFDGFVKPLFLGKLERAQLQQDRPQLEDSAMPDAPAPPPTLPALRMRSEAMDEKANLVTLTVTTAPPQCFQNLPRRKRDRIVGQKYIYNTLVCIWNGKRVFCDGELFLRIGKEMRDIALHRKL